MIKASLNQDLFLEYKIVNKAEILAFNGSLGGLKQICCQYLMHLCMSRQECNSVCVFDNEGDSLCRDFCLNN